MLTNVLLLVEGASTEAKFLERFFDITHYDACSIVPYQTNLYFLAKLLDQIDTEWERLDLIEALLSAKTISEKDKAKLKGPFTDIFLVFDLDIHAVIQTGGQVTPFDKIKILRKMAATFTSSTDQGLLVLSSPMCDSFKDMYFDGRWKLNSPISKYDSLRYKEIVAERGIQLPWREWSQEDFLALGKLHNALTTTCDESNDEVINAAQNSECLPIISGLAKLPFELYGSSLKESADTIDLTNAHLFQRKNARKGAK